MLKWMPPLVVTPDPNGATRQAVAADGAELYAGVSAHGAMVAITCPTRLPTLPEIASGLNALDLPPALPRTWAIMLVHGDSESETSQAPPGGSYAVMLRPIAGAVSLKTRSGPVLQ